MRRCTDESSRLLVILYYCDVVYYIDRRRRVRSRNETRPAVVRGNRLIEQELYIIYTTLCIVYTNSFRRSGRRQGGGGESADEDREMIFRAGAPAVSRADGGKHETRSRTDVWILDTRRVDGWTDETHTRALT